MKHGMEVTAVVVMVVAGFVSTAHATNGYFQFGYGTTNKGLAGAGVALPQDTLAAATNPAGMVFLGKRYDFGLAVFNPNREYTVTGNPTIVPGCPGAPGCPFGLAPGTQESDSNFFVIPSIGANWMLNSESSIGVSIYGNGGMNTDYPTNTFGGSSPTGVDLSQLFVGTTYALKLTPNHAVGVTGILAFQRFEAQGLKTFGDLGFSSDPNNLTNNGHENSYGYGLRIGYTGEVWQNLNLGVSYQTKTSMTELDDYAGLFAERGGFDIPSNWTIGLAYKMDPGLTFVLDVQQIRHSDIKSINNPFLPNLQTSLLGNSDGAGFGWEDITIYKFGAQWQSREDLTWRVGYSIGEEPYPSSEMLFNILAPGVVEQHLTFGLTKAMPNNRAINFSLMHALSNSVSGPNPLDPAQTIKQEMDQWDVDISYSWMF